MSFVRFLIERGIVPTKELKAKLRDTKDFIESIFGGIVPPNRLLYNEREDKSIFVIIELVQVILSQEHFVANEVFEQTQPERGGETEAMEVVEIRRHKTFSSTVKLSDHGRRERERQMTKNEK